MATTKQLANKAKAEKTRGDVGLGLSLAGGALSGFGAAFSSRGAPLEEESSTTDLAVYLIPAAVVLVGGVVAYKVWA